MTDVGPVPKSRPRAFRYPICSDMLRMSCPLTMSEMEERSTSDAGTAGSVGGEGTTFSGVGSTGRTASDVVVVVSGFGAAGSSSGVFFLP